MKLSKNLSFYLESTKTNTSELAKATGIPVSTLHGWLNGVDPKNLTQLKKVAQFFQLTIDELCFNEEQANIVFKNYANEINAGLFEVVLKRVNNNNK
ncbi:MAG: helix-turn-helix transcriptional regulator [Halobacteriovoraceae bacterium]|nr:helix-turn-helix transcriptional regulator [Halobacteriovoraceae bacterium]